MVNKKDRLWENLEVFGFGDNKKVKKKLIAVPPCGKAVDPFTNEVISKCFFCGNPDDLREAKIDGAFTAPVCGSCYDEGMEL